MQRAKLMDMHETLMKLACGRNTWPIKREGGAEPEKRLAPSITRPQIGEHWGPVRVGQHAERSQNPDRGAQCRPPVARMPPARRRLSTKRTLSNKLQSEAATMYGGELLHPRDAILQTMGCGSTVTA